MHIQINTDRTISGHEKQAEDVKGVIISALEKLSDRITRVEVHLSDEDGKKRGQNDVRCMLEARIEGRQPTAVTHHASSLDDAVEGAAQKLRHALEHALGKIEGHRQGRDTVRHPS